MCRNNAKYLVPLLLFSHDTYLLLFSGEYQQAHQHVDLLDVPSILDLFSAYCENYKIDIVHVFICTEAMYIPFHKHVCVGIIMIKLPETHCPVFCNKSNENSSYSI